MLMSRGKTSIPRASFTRNIRHLARDDPTRLRPTDFVVCVCVCKMRMCVCVRLLPLYHMGQHTILQLNQTYPRSNEMVFHLFYVFLARKTEKPRYYYPILIKQPEMLLNSYQSSECAGPLTTRGGHW